MTPEREQVAISGHDERTVAGHRSGEHLIVVRVASDPGNITRAYDRGKELVFRARRLGDRRWHTESLAQDLFELEHEPSARDDLELTAQGPSYELAWKPAEQHRRDEHVGVKKDAHLACVASPSLFHGAKDFGLGDPHAPSGLPPGGEDALPALEPCDVLAERLAQELAATAPFRPSDAIDLARECRRERDRDSAGRSHLT